jgi:ADP-heptose:LPS heptosyltransferase
MRMAASLRSLIISAPGDKERGTRIATAAGVAYAPTAGVREAFALVASADAVFTPDTAIVHAASAFGVPMVAMYPSGKRVPYGPYKTAGWCVESVDTTLTVTVGRSGYRSYRRDADRCV